MPRTVVVAVTLIALRFVLTIPAVLAANGAGSWIADALVLLLPTALVALIALGDRVARHLMGAVIAWGLLRLVWLAVFQQADPTAPPPLRTPLFEGIWSAAILACLYHPDSHPWFRRRPIAAGAAPEDP